MVHSQAEKAEYQIRTAIGRGERLKSNGRVKTLTVLRGGKVVDLRLSNAEDEQRLRAGNVYGRIMREKGEVPTWGERRRAYVPQGNNIYA